MQDLMRHTILGTEYLLEQLPSNTELPITILDCTFGKGLHSNLILEKYPNSNIIAVDYDLRNTKYIAQEYMHRIQFIHKNFIHVAQHLIDNNIKVDIIMLDLGAHMEQILDKSYGLSFMLTDADIDMRIDNTSPDINTAKHILQYYTQTELANIFKYYGNISNYTKLVANIIHYRKQHKFDQIHDIFTALKISPHHNKSILAKIFQAIRIEVNNEIMNLVKLLLSLNKYILYYQLSIKLITFTFHSLEDKIIKNFMQNKTIGHGLEEMFGDMNIPGYIAQTSDLGIICYESTKKIYKGDRNRRKDLFFVVRSCLIRPIDGGK